MDHLSDISHTHLYTHIFIQKILFLFLISTFLSMVYELEKEGYLSMNGLSVRRYL